MIAGNVKYITQSHNKLNFFWSSGAGSAKTQYFESPEENKRKTTEKYIFLSISLCVCLHAIACIFIAIYKIMLHPNVHITVLRFNKCFLDIKMALMQALKLISSHKRKPIIIPKGTNSHSTQTLGLPLAAMQTLRKRAPSTQSSSANIGINKMKKEKMKKTKQWGSEKKRKKQKRISREPIRY